MASADSIRKSPWMFGLILFCWGCAVLYFNPRLLALLVGPENILAKSAIIAFTLLLDLFWFYAFYHLIIILFSYSIKKTPLHSPLNEPDKLNNPAVALLYATCNDFKEEAVLSYFALEYPNFHTFILDDSNEKDYKRRIDSFASRYKEKVTLIRRQDRQCTFYSAFWRKEMSKKNRLVGFAIDTKIQITQYTE